MSALPIQFETEVYPGIRRADPETVSQAEREEAIKAQLATTTLVDLLDELCDCKDDLQAAIVRGDARLIGQIVLNVRKAFATRCADSYLYGSGVAPGITTAQAAAMAVYGGVL